MRLKDEKFYKTVRDFLDIYLIKHRGYSLNTQKSYREAINLLLLYFKTELGLEYASIGFEDITYSNITGFLEWLSKSRGCSPATVNLRLMAIRSFTKYAGILDSGKIYMQVEVGNISVRKTPGKVVEFLTAPALETLFEQPNRFKTNGYRDFCFMRLMYDTAARCQELVDAKIHDLSIRKTHATICLTGKGNKLRIVPISPSVVELLKTYLDKAHPTEQRQSDDYLFFTTHHGRKSRMSTDAVNLFMKKYGEMAKEVGGHGGMDFIMDSRLVYCLQNGLPLDMDVYVLAEWCCLAELGALSMDNNSAPVAVPDFTRGHWNELKGYSHAYASPEDEAAAEKAAKEFTAGMKAGGEKFLKKYWKTETQKNKKAAKKAK